jgi:hypothetical protein
MFASSLSFASIKNVVCLALSVAIVSASLAVGALGIQSLETRASSSQISA